MSLHRDTAHRTTQLLRLAATIAPMPDEVVRLRAHLDAFERTAGQHRVVDVLADAVTTGDTESMPLLFAAALAEQTSTPQTAAEVVAGVRQRMHRTIRDRVAANGADLYRQAAEKFTVAAERFLDAYATTDVEACAEVAVGLPDRQRKAWQAAPVLAEELDRLAPSVHACGVLAGLIGDDANGEIAAVVDSNGVATETIAAAWMTRESERRAARSAANLGGVMSGPSAPTPRRCGRWSALLESGATIRARTAELAAT